MTQSILEGMIQKSSALWRHEVRSADAIARGIIETRPMILGWRKLLLPLWIADTLRIRRSLSLTRKNLLFTKRLAFRAAKAVSNGENRAWEFRRIEIETQKILDHDKKGLYTDKVRRKQLIEIERLIDHYLNLIKSQKPRYDDAIRSVYRSRDAYRSFLNEIQKVETEVIQAATTTTRKGSKKERVQWFEKVKSAINSAKIAELESMFPR